MTTAQRSEDRDGNRHYVYPPTGELLVSVTTILGATEGKPYLTSWAARLAAEYAVDNLDLVAKTLGTEGRDAAVTLAKDQAKEIRERKADAGTYVHDVVEALILWGASPDRAGAEIVLPVLPEHLAGADYDDQPLEDVVEWMIEGFINFTTDWQPEFQAAEMAVFNPQLGVAGTLDIIATLHGYGIGNAGRFTASPRGSVTPCIDVKTGKHLSATWREQVACYRRMRECLLPMGDVAPMPVTDCAAVLHLRPEHPRGYRLMLVAAQDDAAAWTTFLSALRVYQDRAKAKAKPGKVCYPLRTDGTMPPPRIADLDGEGYGRVLGHLTKAGVDDLEQLAALDAGDCLAIKGIAGKSLEVIRVMLADHGLHLAGEAPAEVA
jgi:hypothetical protein